LSVTGQGGSGAVPSSFSQAILNESGPSTLTIDELNNASQLLTQRCMQAKHLVFYPLILPAAAQPHSLFYPLYGSLAQRRANGYGIYAASLHQVQSGQSTGSSTTEDKYRRSMSKAQQASYDRALFGPASARRNLALAGGLPVNVPVGGCAGQVNRELYGSPANAAQVTSGASMLSLYFMRAVEQEPQYQQAMSNWSRCMSGQGYHDPNPYTAYNALSQKMATAGPTHSVRKLEISVAVADFQCAVKTGLVTRINRTQDDVMRHFGASFEGVLLRQVSLTEAALRRARALVPGLAGK